MRIAVGVCFLVLLCGCERHALDLGGDDAQQGAARRPTTMSIVTCGDDASDMSATLGAGFHDIDNAACNALPGPVHQVSSTADLTQLVVGRWVICAPSTTWFGIDFGTPVDGIELTSDGRYGGLRTRSDGTLVSVDSYASPSCIPLPCSSGCLLDASATAPPSAGATGTFDIVDGSSAYGPGTFAMRFHPNGGGLFDGEIIVTDSPRQIHFLPTNATEQVYAAALPWSPRAGVCSCVDTTAPAIAENDANALANAMKGRWLLCGGVPSRLGVEFPGDGTWYGLAEDSMGNLSRSTADNSYGTLRIIPTASVSSLPGPYQFPRFTGPEPLTILLTVQPGGRVNPVFINVTASPRALFWDDDPCDWHDYSIFFPLP